MTLLNDSHMLAVGDQVSFRVIEDEEPPKTLSVTASGEMEVPYVGRIAAAGKNCKTLAYQLKSALEKEWYLQATVILGLDAIGPKDSTPKGKVYMTGQIRSIGAIDIPADETLTLSRAILRAGGFAEFANKRKVRVTHKGRNGQAEAKFYDCIEIIEKGKHEQDVTLEPDDVIFVPDRWLRFQ